MGLTEKTLPSNKKFGLFMATVFAISYIFIESISYKYFFLALAIIFGVLGVIKPKILQPLNSAWHKLGLLLGKFINPVILGVIYYVLITPIAVIARLMGRDPLRLKKKQTKTYWINREPKGPNPESFKDQY